MNPYDESRFDEEPAGDPHGECAAEIASLRAALAKAEGERDRARDLVFGSTGLVAGDKLIAERDSLRRTIEEMSVEFTALRSQMAEALGTADGYREACDRAEGERDSLRAKLAEIDRERAEYGQHAGCRINERRALGEIKRLRRVVSRLLAVLADHTTVKELSLPLVTDVVRDARVVVIGARPGKEG